MLNSNKCFTFLQNIYRYLLRFILFFYSVFLGLLIIVPKKKSPAKVRILATGTFYSDHWLITHLRPMANANSCLHLKMVATTQVPEMNKVQGEYSPKWLQNIAGQVGSRLIYFTWLAIKERPDVLVGFHLLVNGLFVAFLARLIGAKSVYICGGGPREVQGGGINTESRIFSRLGESDEFIEKCLLKAVNSMDLVITMGTSAIDYFKENGVTAHFEIIAGGFDNDVFSPDKSVDKIFDFILIGRLSEIKRVDRFLHAIHLVKEVNPGIRAVIVGDGPEKLTLQQQAQDLGLTQNVIFTGWQDNVDEWIKQSKCFVLTSDSEGLSQALIQAMMTGLPAITSNVGDLSDLLINEVNGYLINDLTPNGFAVAFVRILKSSDVLENFSTNACSKSKTFSVANVERKWDKLLLTI